MQQILSQIYTGDLSSQSQSGSYVNTNDLNSCYNSDELFSVTV